MAEEKNFEIDINDILEQLGAEIARLNIELAKQQSVSNMLVAQQKEDK